jgi:hypothetical protein
MQRKRMESARPLEGQRILWSTTPSLSRAAMQGMAIRWNAVHVAERANGSQPRLEEAIRELRRRKEENRRYHAHLVARSRESIQRSLALLQRPFLRLN